MHPSTLLWYRFLRGHGCGDALIGQMLKYLHSTHRPPSVSLPESTRRTIDMDEIYLQCAEPEPADRSIAADVLLREEPDEEDEDEEEHDSDEEDDDGDEGYSE